MKKIILIMAVIFAATTSLYSQSARSIIVEKLVNMGYTIADEKYTRLTEGEDANYYRKMYEGYTYAIIAYSEDDDVKDIDIYLYDDDGSLLVKDTDTDNFALVKYTPYYSREMKINVLNYSSDLHSYDYKIKIIVAYKQ